MFDEIEQGKQAHSHPHAHLFASKPRHVTNVLSFETWQIFHVIQDKIRFNLTFM